MISSLRLQNFRSYTDTTIELESGVNIVVGPNASGKTNLLEAVLVTATGSSYRAKDADLVRFDAPWARLDSAAGNSTRTVKLEPQGTQYRKSYLIDEVPLTQLRHERQLPVVVFEPEHMLLLTGSPDQRRLFMDTLLTQLVPGFANTRQHYKRALAQRNNLLKKGYAYAKGQLFPWNVRLSDLGGHIAARRSELLDRCNGYISDIYSSIASTTQEVSLRYKTPFSIEVYSSQLLKTLESKAETDCIRGFTAYGPHREDMEIILNGHPATETASRGETRTLMLALKILELQLVEEAKREKPILLLDDVFSELDGARRKALTGFLTNYQTLITTTDADIVVKHFMNACHIIPTNHE